MKVAELFVNIGVTGSKSAAGALKDVKTGLGGILSMGLETKAMLAAIAYGVEKMMSGSAQAGTNLANFESLTGRSAQALQKWQYAAKLAGGSAEDAASAFKIVQEKMALAQQGQGLPSGFAMVANAVKLDEKQLLDPEYMLKKLQEFAQKVPAVIGNDKLKSFGLSDSMIAMMRRNAFNQDAFSKAPLISEGQIQSLNRVDGAFANLGAHINKAFADFTSKHGMKIVSDLTKITDGVIRLVEALTQLGDKLKVFDALAKVVDFLTTMTSLGAQAADDASGKSQKNNFKKGSALGSMIDFRNSVDKSVMDFFKLAVPQNAPSQINQPPRESNVTVHQTLQFRHDGRDATKVADTHRRAAQAYRQSSAQVQEN